MYAPRSTETYRPTFDLTTTLAAASLPLVVVVAVTAPLPTLGFLAGFAAAVATAKYRPD